MRDESNREPEIEQPGSAKPTRPSFLSRAKLLALSALGLFGLALAILFGRSRAKRLQESLAGPEPVGKIELERDSTDSPARQQHQLPVHFSTEHPHVRREVKDVRFSLVAWLIVLSALIGAAQLYGVWEFFDRGKRLSEPSLAEYTRSGDQLPAQPQLEQLRRVEEKQQENARTLQPVDLQRLGSFGQTDEAGYVHIPIADAMDLVVSRLPVRQQPASRDNATRGLVGGGEPNSGRLFRGANE
jgi:hypothetical protein